LAKLVYIGPHPKNWKKFTSKAWTIRRSGKSVLMKWGPVESRGYGTGSHLRWAMRLPKRQTKRFRTEALATSYVKERIAVRLSHGYKRMAGKVRIYPPMRR
jgi:hypothetical protein